MNELARGVRRHAVYTLAGHELADWWSFAALHNLLDCGRYMDFVRRNITGEDVLQIWH